MQDLNLKLIVGLVDRATAGIKRIGETVEALHGRIEHLNHVTSAIGIGEVIGAAVAVEGVRKIAELTKSTAEMGEQLELAAKKAGVTTEEIQKLRFAADQFGVSPDSVDQFLFRFQTRMGAAIGGAKPTMRAFDAIGLHLKDLKKLSKDPEEALLRVSDAFARIHNPTVRAKLALDLFSRSGYEMLPILTAGRAQIEAMFAKRESLGGLVNEKDIENSVAYVRALKTLHTALDLLRLRVGTRLLGPMTALVDRITDFITRLKPQEVNRFADSLVKIMVSAVRLAPVVADAAQKLANLLDKITRGGPETRLFIGALVALVGLQVASWTVEAAAAMMTLSKAIGLVSLMGLLGELPTLIGLFAAAVPEVGFLTAAMTTLDVAMWANPVGLIIAAILALIAVVALVIVNWDKIAPFFAALWARVTATLRGAWSGVLGFFQNLLSNIENVFSSGWQRITAGVPPWMKALMGAGAIGLAATVSPVLAAPVASIVNGPAPGAAGAHADRLDVHLHVTGDGQVRTKKIASSSPSTTVSVHHGQFPQ